MATPCHAVPSRLHGWGVGLVPGRRGAAVPAPAGPPCLAGTPELQQTHLASLHRCLPHHASRSSCTYVRGHKLFQAVLPFPSSVAGYAAT